MPKNLPALKIVWIAALALITGCSVNRKISRNLDKVFNESETMSHYQPGFALYDLSKAQMIFERNSDKYFTPASNTKLFTFFAGLKVVPDSIPGLRYIERQDSLIFWGTGDPSFLQSELKSRKVLDFLAASNKKIFFAPGRYTGGFYGAGWQWDDYNDYYQAEINEFPVLDNLVDVKKNGSTLKITPRLFTPVFKIDSTSATKNFRVTRDFLKNEFKYPLQPVPDAYNQKIPFKVDVETTVSILADTLGKPIGQIKMTMPSNAKTIYSSKSDDVLKEMMLPSDNFIAEQLLLVYADKLGLELNADKAIEYVQKEYLGVLPDKFIWADGSGLSRYNLVTPRAIIKLLDMIYKEVNNTGRLYGMLPAGGMSGTLKNAYPKTDKPFVFGKTGSLANVHNQSGYVVTKSGKTFLFSFMNNNYTQPTAEIRKEMVRIMTLIHEKY
ncbi:MAG: peptidase S13 [Pedobacter sp.]|nr:MAG: peptidase S13 [Pedobacter sp.]